MKQISNDDKCRAQTGKRGGGYAAHLVAIVGGSGAGKTWLARELQRRLGEGVAILALDDFYRDRSGLSVGRRGQINFDHPRAIDWPLLRQVLERSQLGRPLEVPQYHFAVHTRRSEPRWWQPKPLIFVEGLWLLRSPAIRKLFELRIFVDCPQAVRLRRRVERDALERGRDASASAVQFLETVNPMCQRYVMPQVRWADVVVNSPIPEKELARLGDRVQQLMFSDGGLSGAGQRRP